MPIDMPPMPPPGSGGPYPNAPSNPSGPNLGVPATPASSGKLYMEPEIPASGQTNLVQAFEAQLAIENQAKLTDMNSIVPDYLLAAKNFLQNNLNRFEITDNHIMINRSNIPTTPEDINLQIQQNAGMFIINEYE